MDVKVRSVGNSMVVTLPKPLTERCEIHAGDILQIYSVENDTISMTKKKKSALERRIERFYGKPIEEVGVIESEETDWGGPVGEEVW